MIKSDKKFKRKCVICSQYKDKSELLRFTIQNDEIIINTNSKVFGRSFYICKDEKCLLQTIKTKALSKYTKLNHFKKLINFISQYINDKNY